MALNLLNAIHALLGQHIQAQSAHPQQLGNNSQLAQQYAQNPQAPQFRGVDPAQFGYPADNSGSQLQVRQPAYGAALGAGFNDLPQGNNFNPGYTPMQGSNNALPQPNLLAPHVPQGINRNPQYQRPLF